VGNDIDILCTVREILSIYVNREILLSFYYFYIHRLILILDSIPSHSEEPLGNGVRSFLIYEIDEFLRLVYKHGTIIKE